MGHSAGDAGHLTAHDALENGAMRLVTNANSAPSGISFIYPAGTANNCPSGTLNGILTTYATEGGYTHQEYSESSNGKRYTRYYSGSTWSPWLDSNDVLDAYATNVPWTNLPLATNWAAYSSGEEPQYCRQGGVGFLRGLVKWTGSGSAPPTGASTLIGTLPAGLRPGSGGIGIIFLLCPTAYGYYCLRVDQSGGVTFTHDSNGGDSTNGSANVWCSVVATYHIDA